MQKNVLSALRRLKVVTKTRLWVAWLASADLFGFLLVSCSIWEAVWCSSICFLTTGQSRMNTEWARKVSEEFRTHSVRFHHADTVLNVYPTNWWGLISSSSHCSWENPHSDASDYTWRKALVFVGTGSRSLPALTPVWPFPAWFSFRYRHRTNDCSQTKHQRLLIRLKAAFKPFYVPSLSDTDKKKKKRKKSKQMPVQHFYECCWTTAISPLWDSKQIQMW